MPVFPEVGSTTVMPGFRTPRRSASSIIAIASRSFTELIGLNASHFTYIVTCAGARWLMRTTGVEPIVPRMLSWIILALSYSIYIVRVRVPSPGEARHAQPAGGGADVP